MVWRGSPELPPNRKLSIVYFHKVNKLGRILSQDLADTHQAYMKIVVRVECIHGINLLDPGRSRSNR